MSHPLGGGGLFGRPKKRKPFDMGAPDYTMPTGGPQYEDMPTGLGMSAPQKPKGRSIVPYLLAAAEDTLSRQMGYQPGGVARLNEQREREAIFQQRAMEQAAKQRAEAQRIADERAYERQKFYEQEEYKRNNPMPTGTQSDIEWYNSLPAPEQAKVNAALDALRPVMTTTWQGPTTIPRSPPVGSSVGLGDFLGQGGGSVQTAPAPNDMPDRSQLDTNAYPFVPRMDNFGNPVTITRGEYNDLLKNRTKADVDEMLQRRGIRIVN